MPNAVYENGLIRVVYKGRQITGGVKMTPEVVARVVAHLRRRTPHDRYLHLPAELLEQVGVTSSDQLEASVEHGRIVLTPKAPSNDEPETPSRHRPD